MSDLDRSLFLALNGDPNSSRALIGLAVFLAKYVILLVPLHMVLVWIAGNRSMRFVALTALLTLCIAIAVNQIIGIVSFRPRPFVVGLGHALIEHRESSSMPSNHATVMFAYTAVLAIFGRAGLAAAFGLLGLGVAWSRVFLGIHYPGDIAVGFVVAALSAAVATAVMMRWPDAPLRFAERCYDRVAGPIIRLFRRNPAR